MTYVLQLNARARFVAESFLTPVRHFLFLFATPCSSYLVRLIHLHRALCCSKVSVSGLGAALHRRFPKIPIRSETFTTNHLPWTDSGLLTVRKDERSCLVPHLRQPFQRKVGLLGVSMLSFNTCARSSRNQHLCRHLYHETVVSLHLPLHCHLLSILNTLITCCPCFVRDYLSATREVPMDLNALLAQRVHLSYLCFIDEEEEAVHFGSRRTMELAEEPTPYQKSNAVVTSSASKHVPMSTTSVNRPRLFPHRFRSSIFVEHLKKATYIRSLKQTFRSMASQPHRRCDQIVAPTWDNMGLRVGDVKCSRCDTHPSHTLEPCGHTICHEHYLQEPGDGLDVRCALCLRVSLLRDLFL